MTQLIVKRGPAAREKENGIRVDRKPIEYQSGSYHRCPNRNKGRREG